MAEYVIKWNQGTNDWEKAQTHAKMYTRGTAEIRFEFVEASVEPAGIIDVTKDASSTDKELVLNLELTPEAKKDPDLLSKIQNPLELTVECKPADEISATAAAIFDNPTSIRKAPVRVEAPFPTVTVVSPVDPIPGDGQPHDVTLEFKMSNGTPVGGVDVSWELVLGQPTPGGEVDPLSATLPQDGDGRATFRYTPPKISYIPKRTYEQPLKVSWSPGGQKAEITTLDLSVNPGLDAMIDAKKLGLAFKDPFHLEFPPGNTPQDVKIHLGFDSVTRENSWNVAGATMETWRYDDFGTKPVISVSADGGTNQVELTDKDLTDAQGLFVWKLPELEKGLLKSDSFKHMTLRPYEQCPTCDFDEEAVRVLDRYYAYLTNDEVAKSLTRLLTNDVRHPFNNHKSTLAKHLAAWPETDAAKARLGTDIVNVSLRGTITVDEIEQRMFESGLDIVSKCLWDLVDAYFAVKAFLVPATNEAVAAASKAAAEEAARKAAGGGEPGMFTKVMRAIAQGFVYTLETMLEIAQTLFPKMTARIGGLLTALKAFVTGAAGAIVDIWREIVEWFKFFQIMLAAELSNLVELLIGTPPVDENVTMRKGSKKIAITLIGKKAQKYLQHGLAGCPSYVELKQQIKDEIPGLGMDTIASATLPTVTKAVDAATYAPNTDTVAYLLAINSLERDRSGLEQSTLKTDLIIAEVDVACLVMSVAFAIYALLNGVPSGAIAANRQFAAVKAAAHGAVHIGQGVQYWTRAYEYQATYEEKTLGLVGASPP